MRGMALSSVLLLALAGCVPQPSEPQPDKPAAAPPAQQAAAQQTERIKAQVGVGKAGRRLDNPDLVKPIVEPARVFFRVEERVVFEIQIPQALSLYKATNGFAPKTQEEFMAQIIDANKIQLPELRAGERYVYDPEQEQLMVERPAARQ